MSEEMFAAIWVGGSAIIAACLIGFAGYLRTNDEPVESNYVAVALMLTVFWPAMLFVGSVVATLAAIAAPFYFAGALIAKRLAK